MKSILLAVATACVSSGCVSTRSLDAASIEYRLPMTEAQVVLDLVLLDCDGTAKLDERLSTLAVAAVAGAQSKVYRISGDALGSSTMARTMKINVSDKGVISSINSGTADKRAQIVADVAKVAASVVTVLAIPGPRPTSICNASTQSALKKYAALRRRLDTLQQEVIDKPDDPELARSIRLINTLATEIAHLRTGDGPLHLVIQAPIELGESQKNEPTGAKALPTDVKLDPVSFAPWFGNAFTAAQANSLFGLTSTAMDVSARVDEVDLGGSSRLRECEHSIPLPRVATVRIEVKPVGSVLLANPPTAEVAGVTSPVAQWRTPARLCTDVGFGENRSIALTFDSFGRTTALEWSSDATLQNITSAAAGSAADFTSLVTTLKGGDLARQKAEIDQLSTQQSLNQWRACKEILAQGGYSCTAPSTTP